MGDAHRAGTADACNPVPLEKLLQQCGANSASDVVVALRPVAALVGEGATLAAHHAGIDLKSRKQALSCGGQNKTVFSNAKCASLQQFVAHRDGQHARQMVVAGAGKAYLGNSGSLRVVGQGAQRLDGDGHVTVLQPEQALSAFALRDDQAT
jgi:hypothetical protein